MSQGNRTSFTLAPAATVAAPSATGGILATVTGANDTAPTPGLISAGPAGKSNPPAQNTNQPVSASNVRTAIHANYFFSPWETPGTVPPVNPAWAGYHVGLH